MKLSPHFSTISTLALAAALVVGCSSEQPTSSAKALGETAADCIDAETVCAGECFAQYEADVQALEDELAECFAAIEECFEANPEDPEVCAALSEDCMGDAASFELEGCLDLCGADLDSCVPDQGDEPEPGDVPDVPEPDVDLEPVFECIGASMDCVDACVGSIDACEIVVPECDLSGLELIETCVDAAPTDIEACLAGLDEIICEPPEIDLTCFDATTPCVESCTAELDVCIDGL